MKKYEYDLAIAHQKGRNVEQWMGFGKHIISCLTGLAAIWLIFEGLKPIVIGNDANTLNALAKVFSAIQVDRIALGIWGGLATTGYLYERKGKKRAIREKNHFQLESEKNDPNRSSSNLGPTGETPKGN